MGLHVVAFLVLLGLIIQSQAADNPKTYYFEIKEANFTRLCQNKTMLTVNGEFPGPTIYAHRGETIVINVKNSGNLGTTIHWHGVKQPRNPWSDGPDFITQCPIKPGTNFSQQMILSDEEGTLWWHAHSDWSRATIHGLIVIWPAEGKSYPFNKPYAEFPIVFAEWWRKDVNDVLLDFLRTGGDPNTSDALTINGQPGDLYPCSTAGTTKFIVEQGQTYLLRMVNAAMNLFLFWGIGGHELHVVGSDGAYTKNLKSHYGVIAPGQSMDILLRADQPIGQYYLAARPYNSQPAISFDNTTTTAIFEYKGYTKSSSKPVFPHLPRVNDTLTSVNFTASLRSLASKDHPIDVPMKITRNFLFTTSINTSPCATRNGCLGPRGLRFSASVNNISFIAPNISVLDAYYGRINGIYGDIFPNFPPLFFNFTAARISRSLETPIDATESVVLEHGDTVELVFQGTNLIAGIDHPMHLHGHSFYVVGTGLGNFNRSRDRVHFNLVDPPLQQTITVPKNGWIAIRFKADNPGVWLMHCHLERHIFWGMEMVFITKDGSKPEEKMLPPPPDLPRCT